jgi:predicted RNase H-like HicB family nuclease
LSGRSENHLAMKLACRLAKAPLGFGRWILRHAMKYYTFGIIIEKEADDPGYSAYTPTLPGCFSNGQTIEEAKHNIREAIQQHIEALLARGQPVPQKETIVHIEELTLGFPG